MTQKGQGRYPINFEVPYFDNSAREMGRQFPIMTSMPVAISIIFDRSQIDVRFLIQVERFEKALRRISQKIMRARSTFD